MANSVVVSTFSGAGGLDNNESRQVLNGNVAFSGVYTQGGLLPNWNSLTDLAGNSVLVSKTSTIAPIVVSKVGVVANVAYFLTGNSAGPAVGQSVTLSSLTANAVVLNNQTLAVIGANVSAGVFSVAFTTGAFANNANISGVASIVAGPDEFSAVSLIGSGNSYVYNKANATIQIFNGNVELATGAGLGTDVIQFQSSYVRN
jgi:hypothetical protein